MQPGESAPNVLLTDTNRWASAARIAIVLAKAGCRVSAICPRRGHPILRTHVLEKTFSYSGLRPLDSLASAIDATQPQIIIPCDDRSVRHLHELFERARRQGSSGVALANLIERSLGPHESYPIVSGRSELLKLAREEGILVPDSAPIGTVGDLKAWQSGHSLPWVLKGDGTFGGKGVRVVREPGTEEQAFAEIGGMYGLKRAIKRAIINRDPFWLRPWWKGIRPAVIAQGYIQGRPANCAVVCWEGKVLAGIGVEVACSIGFTGPATVVRVVDNPEMMLAAERIAGRLKLSGFFGLDFMIDDETGRASLIEMNPRCTPLCHLQLGEGRDMVGMLWAQLAQKPFEQTPPVTQNDLIAYFPPTIQDDPIMYFPRAYPAGIDVLNSSYEDIPRDEPDLVEELLKPWPETGFVCRATSKLSAFMALFASRKQSEQGGTSHA